jgi:hypothetical protein
MVITSRESGGTTMIKSVPPDLLYLCAELVTGKSVPVLVGITRLPIGQALAWAMVTLGAVAGTLFSVYASRRASGVALLGFGNRLLQLGFSLALSVSLLLSLASGIHPQRGPALAVIPVFFSLVHSLPQRHSTGLVSLVLGLLVLYVCTLAGEAELAERLPDIIRARRAHLVAPSPPAASLAPPSGLTLGEVIARALQLFTLSFYACVQHAPTQVYFRTDETSACDPAYASHHHARHAPYSLFIGLTAAWVRVLVWSAVCFMPDNALHALLEGDYSRNEWACIILYMTALLYSACWTATQAREQVLPYFCVATEAGRLKALVCIVALAALYRQRSPDAMFYATDALSGVCVLAALLQIET